MTEQDLQEVGDRWGCWRFAPDQRGAAVECIDSLIVEVRRLRAALERVVSRGPGFGVLAAREALDEEAQ